MATSKRLERAVKRAPGGELAAWRSASGYVASRSLSGAIATVEMLLEQGHGASVDLFGEDGTVPADPVSPLLPTHCDTARPATGGLEISARQAKGAALVTGTGTGRPVASRVVAEHRRKG